jgi:branched-chain amino acid transport system substrate-binding protein
MANAAERSTDPAAHASATDATYTRAFLFADLRAYTAFADRHGDASAAELLVRYRALVRRAIDRFHGAEIRTEGDSFYVVFVSVSEAVRCGLEITREAAAETSEGAEDRISVGVGINAGETFETPDGYVGSSVNIAARICAQAGPGEVLVSETVRSLTRTVLPVHFEPRGRRHLKGVADPMALFAVTEATPGAAPWRRPRGWSDRLARRRILAAVALVGAGVIAAAAWWASSRPAAGGLPAGPWHIGVDMPLSGEVDWRGIPVRDAVKLAIDATNRSGRLDVQLVLDEYDDAGDMEGGMDPERGAANAAAMAEDPRTIAVIGPWASAVAYEMIPITNEAGLFQCSPANTSPGLTKPHLGATQLRRAAPDRINYVRLPPADDVQGPALASFAYHDRRLRTMLVVDDTEFGEDVADGFREAFERLGGTTTRTRFPPGSEPPAALEPLADLTAEETGVFFGGITETGAPELRTAMVEGGYGAMPFISWDGIIDGSGALDGSYIERAGDAALGSYASTASLPGPTASFVDAYRQAYGVEPDQYAAAGYACVEIIVQALEGVAPSGPTEKDLREAVRAYAVDTSHDHETVLGPVTFDGNGDPIRQYVTFYGVQASAADGAGDWVPIKQQDFRPTAP